ncbi:hypothetical protein PMAYCL1PPCAC_19912, partial [Pristionchus mayeri]
RVVAAVVWLAAAAAALQFELNPAAKEAMEKATPAQRKEIDKMLEELARSVRQGEADAKTAAKRDGTMIKWHSMSEVRRLQREGKKLVIARIEPIDSEGFERRLEVVAAELRARGAEEATWVKRSVPADDDVQWMLWEQVPSATQLFFLSGDPEERAMRYKGSDSITDLLTWMLKLLPPPRPKEITTEQEMDQFMLASPVSVIAYVPGEMGADGSFHAFVKKIAQRHPYLPVGMVYPAEELPYTRHALAPIAIYYRDEDHVFPLDEDRLQEMDDFTRDNALKKASHQFISRFPDDAAHIFSQGIDKIVFVFDYVAEHRGQTPSYLRELALEMRQRVVIAYVDANDERMNSVRAFFGVQSAQAVRGFDSRTERQYWPERPQGVAFPHEVQAFVRDLAANKLAPHRKVEEINPKINEEGATIKLNSDTFETIALDPSVDSVVCFFATWCPHSKRFIEKFLQAGQESTGKRKVVFGLVDVERNDVETKNKIRLFPTVILFRKNTNEEVVFVGRRNLVAFLKWLDEEVDRQPKKEEPVVEEDETAKGYESPLRKNIKHDAEQQYTLEGLEAVDGRKGGRRRKSRTEGMAAVQDKLAERVLEKLKIERPTIVEALEMGRDTRKAVEEMMEKRNTVEKKKNDTVEKKEEDTVEKKGKDTIEKKKEDTVEKKKDTVEEKKDTVEKEEEDTVEKKENDTVEKKKDMVDKEEEDAVEKREEEAKENKNDDTVLKKEVVEVKKKGAEEEKKKDAVEKREKEVVEEKKKSAVDLKEKDTVVDKKKETVEEKKNTVVEKDVVKETVEENKKEQSPKEKTPEPVAKKSTVVEKLMDTVEKTKSTVVETPDKKAVTVDPKDVPKKIVVKQPPVKSEL